MKKIILALVAILVVCGFTPTTALSQATVGTATIAAQGSFTLNGGDVLTLQAQLTGCFANVPLYSGNPISLMPNQPTNGFVANGSQVVSLTLPGNDKILCGLQNYTMYALTWRVNGYPVTPTKTYRFSDSSSYNLSLVVPVGFVPPVLANAAGVLCSTGNALAGFDKDYHPVCVGVGTGGSGSLPSATAAGAALVSTAPGSVYTAQPLGAAALSNIYSDLNGRPSLGTASTHAFGDFDAAGAAAAAQAASIAAAASAAAAAYIPIAGDVQVGVDLRGTDGSSYITILATQALIQAALGGSTGGTGGGTTGVLPTGIGTIVRQGVLTDGTVAYKTCYVGSSVCSGGVGSIAPSSTPSRSAGLNTPSAGSGTSNAVTSYSFSTTHAAPSFTDVLWTTTGGGLGADTTSTNWYRDFYVRTAYPAGHTHFEFDTYNFDGTWDWMWGTQCNATKNIIQIDNQTNGWIDTPIPCAILFDGNYHHIQQTFHRDLAATHNCASGSAPCQWWDAMAIDDKLYAIGRSLPATSTTWSGSGGQIQTDTEPTTQPATATVYIDTDTVIAGLASDANTNPGGGGTTPGGTGELGSFSFDGGSPTAGLTAFGTPSIQTANVHTATKSALFPGSTNSYYTYSLPTSGQVLYTRQYVYITSVGSTAMSLLRFYHGGGELFVWYLSTGGVLTAFDQATSSDISTGYTMSTATIHLVETYTKISATAGQVIAKVDGTTVFTSAATLNTGTASIDTAWFGAFGAAAPVGWGNTYEDNVDFSAAGFIGTI